MTSPDLTEANIDKFAEFFPTLVTETVDADGTVRKAIDFDLLRQELADHIVEGPQERYRLDWPGKRAAAFAANAPIAKTLRPVREESVDFDTTKNLFIEGDNLDALKLLQESYLGKIRLIYIDPPYNTGNDFVYSDDFSETTAEYLARSGQTDDEGSRLSANTESNGRFHSDWLSMMYPRLRLARNLMTNDGSIFISADDHESANLRRICDEIFGEGNFQADISWQKRYTRSNNTQDFTTVVEHILVYSRSDEFAVNLLPRTEEADGRYSNPDKDVRGPWKGASFLNPATPQQRPNLCYPVENPNTGQVTVPSSNAWRRSKEEFGRLGSEGLLYWGSDGRSPVPSIKMFLSGARGLTPINFWEHSYAGNTDDGTRDLVGILGSKLFDNPKPVRLLTRILEHATDSDSIILDFFAGSGTTAQAVLEKNAEDGGNRHFVMVQLDEVPHHQSEAAKAGYATIAAVSRERVKRSGAQVNSQEVASSFGIDVGFRALRIDSTNMADVLRSPDETDQLALDQLEGNVKAGRSNEDLLFQVMLDWGLELTLPMAVDVVDGHEVFVVEDGALVACFDTEITPGVVQFMAKLHPERAVFRDSGFASDDARINAEQVFSELSPASDVKAI